MSDNLMNTKYLHSLFFLNLKKELKIATKRIKDTFYLLNCFVCKDLFSKHGVYYAGGGGHDSGQMLKYCIEAFTVVYNRRVTEEKKKEKKKREVN